MTSQNSRFKSIVPKIKTVFITLMMVLVLCITAISNYLSYLYKKQNPDLYLPWAIKGEKPSKEKITKLLRDITDNLPQQGSSYYKNQGVYESFVLISKTYINPTQQTINQVENNIAQQNIWAKINSEQANTQIFCHEQIMLEKHYNRNELEKYLYISIRWDSTGECHDLYYNPDSNLAKRLLQSP